MDRLSLIDLMFDLQTITAGKDLDSFTVTDNLIARLKLNNIHGQDLKDEIEVIKELVIKPLITNILKFSIEEKNMNSKDRLNLVNSVDCMLYGKSVIGEDVPEIDDKINKLILIYNSLLE